MRNGEKCAQIWRHSMLLGDELYTIQEVPEIERILEKRNASADSWVSSSGSSSAHTISDSTHFRERTYRLNGAYLQNYLPNNDLSQNLTYWKMKLEMMKEKKKYINQWMAETSEKICKAIEKVKEVTEKLQDDAEHPGAALSTSSNDGDGVSNNNSNMSSCSDYSTASTKRVVAEKQEVSGDDSLSLKVTERLAIDSEETPMVSCSSIDVVPSVSSAVGADSYHSATSQDTVNTSITELSVVQATANTITVSEDAEEITEIEDIEEKLKQRRNALNYFEFDQLPSRPDEAMNSIPESVKSLAMDTMKMLEEQELVEMRRLYGVLKRAGKVDQMLVYELGNKAFPNDEQPDGDWKIPAPDAYFTFGKALLTVFHATVLLSGGDAQMDDDSHMAAQKYTSNRLGGIINYWKDTPSASSQRILMRQEQKLLQLSAEKASNAKRFNPNPAYAHIKSRYMEPMKRTASIPQRKFNKTNIRLSKTAAGRTERRKSAVPTPQRTTNMKQSNKVANVRIAPSPHVEDKPNKLVEEAKPDQLTGSDSTKEAALTEAKQPELDNLKFTSSMSLGDFPNSQESNMSQGKGKPELEKSPPALKITSTPTWKLTENARINKKKRFSAEQLHNLSDSGSSTSLYKQHQVSMVDSEEEFTNFDSMEDFEIPKKSFVVFSKDKYVEVKRAGREDNSDQEKYESLTFKPAEDTKEGSFSIVRKLYRNLPALRPLIVDTLIANLVVAYVVNLTGNAFCEPQKTVGFTCTVSHALKGKLRTMLIRALRLVDDF